MQASARLSSSAAAFRKVIVGVSSATARSCYRTSRGKAHAAPLPVRESPLKGRKMMPKQERKARIVEFVDNYRASNEGKYPSITKTRQQVGGSFHTARVVLQEMKYYHAQQGNPKPPPLQGAVEVTVHPMQKDEARLLENQRIPEDSMAEDDAEVAQRQGTVQVSDHSTPKGDAEVAQLQGTVWVSEHSTSKDDAEVAQLQGTAQVSEHSTPKGDAEVAELQGTAQVSEHSTPKDVAEVAQLQGTAQVSEHSTPKDDAEVARLQGTVEVSEKSLPKDEGKVDQFQGTESESLKDLTLKDKPDPGNQQREIEANQFNLKNSKESLDANASNASDESVANEAKTHAREDDPKHEESVKTGLLGSLKSFAYGIRNFWKNM